MSTDSLDEHDLMQEVYAYAEKVRVPIDPLWHQEAQLAGDAAAQSKAKELALLDPDKEGVAYWVAWFNRTYPKFLKAMLGAGEILLTFAHTFGVAFVLPGLLIWAVSVEKDRVFNGAILIDDHADLAHAVAWVLVLGNLLVELVIHWDEHRLGWPEPEQFKWSWRIWGRNLLYWAGVSQSQDEDKWEPERKSPSVWARGLLRLITITILLLAIGGNMAEVMKLAGDATWINAMVNIVTTSTLQQMINLIGGVATSITMVFLVQGLSQYLAKRVIEIVEIMSSDVDDKALKIAKAAGFAMAAHLTIRIREAERAIKRGQIVATSAVDAPAISGASGVVFVPSENQVTRASDESAVDQERTSEQESGFKTKVDEAVHLLRTNAHYSKLSLDDLVELHPHIKRHTWWKARNR